MQDRRLKVDPGLTKAFHTIAELNVALRKKTLKRASRETTVGVLSLLSTGNRFEKSKIVRIYLDMNKFR